MVVISHSFDAVDDFSGREWLKYRWRWRGHQERSWSMIDRIGIEKSWMIFFRKEREKNPNDHFFECFPARSYILKRTERYNLLACEISMKKSAIEFRNSQNWKAPKLASGDCTGSTSRNSQISAAVLDLHLRKLFCKRRLLVSPGYACSSRHGTDLCQTPGMASSPSFRLCHDSSFMLWRQKDSLPLYPMKSLFQIGRVKCVWRLCSFHAICDILIQIFRFQFIYSPQCLSDVSFPYVPSFVCR